tara:strand:- start:652 stop:1071 length:420 start_codon:yes stop_codon:yes gene_type:complete
MVLEELKTKQDLESYKTQFKNIKNRLIQHYPDFVNTNEKKGFNNAKSALTALYNNLTIKDTQIQAEISSVGSVIKKGNTNIRVAKSRYMSDIKNLNTDERVNAASDELKIDKYNENVEEYLKSFFSLFGIVLMVQFVRL